MEYGGYLSTWVSCLDKATWIHNTSRHHATKFTPFEIFFGREPTIPETNSEPRNEIDIDINEAIKKTYNEILKLNYIFFVYSFLL